MEGPIGDIDGVGGRAELCGGCFGLVGIDIGNDDAGAGFAQAGNDALADARSSARDNRGTVGEVKHEMAPSAVVEEVEDPIPSLVVWADKDLRISPRGGNE